MQDSFISKCLKVLFINRWICLSSHMLMKSYFQKKPLVSRFATQKNSMNQTLFPLEKSPLTLGSVHSHAASLRLEASLRTCIFYDLRLRFNVRQIFQELAARLLMCPKGWQRDRHSLWVAVGASVSIFIFLCTPTLSSSTSPPPPPSPSLMPLSVLRLIKRPASQPPPHQPSSASPQYQLTATTVLETCSVCERVCSYTLQKCMWLSVFRVS